MTAAAKQEIQITEGKSVVPQTPMDLLNQAVLSGNIELAEKLMGLQERWEKNQARKSFDAAVAAVKAEIKPVTRNRKAHNGRYADFSAIAQAVDPVLSKYGLSYRFRSQQGDKISVTCILSHKDGHFEETTLTGPADTSGNKNAIQAIGSALTYLQRYSLVQMLGLAAAHDDDGNAGPISTEQLKTLAEKIAQVGANVESFCQTFGIESPSELPAAKFDEAINRLTNYGKKKGAIK